MMSSVILPIAYLPSLQYLQQVINTTTVVIEKQEYYVKQTIRNRCEILSSTGTMRLSIPLIQKSDKELIHQKRISYAENWQHQHWRSITTAYKSSPYFEFFEHELKPFYENKYEFLFEYNLELLNTILNILRVKKELYFTEEYLLHHTNLIDLRSNKFINSSSQNPYYQVFEDKLGFTQNLSCIDALFHVGLDVLKLV